MPEPRSILIVEDEPLIAMMLEDFLERALNAVAGTANRMTERIEEILEHHRDQRFVLDNED